MYFKVICAWCGKFIRFKEGPDDESAKLPISHGICAECKERLIAQTESLGIPNNEQK